MDCNVCWSSWLGPTRSNLGYTGPRGELRLLKPGSEVYRPSQPLWKSPSLPVKGSQGGEGSATEASLLRQLPPSQPAFYRMPSSSLAPTGTQLHSRLILQRSDRQECQLMRPGFFRSNALHFTLSFHGFFCQSKSRVCYLATTVRQDLAKRFVYRSPLPTRLVKHVT